MQRPAGLKRLERKFRRLRLYLFQLYLRGNLSLGMPCTALQPTSKPGQPQNNFIITDMTTIKTEDSMLLKKRGFLYRHFLS